MNAIDDSLEVQDELTTDEAVDFADAQLEELADAGIHGALSELALRTALQHVGMSRDETEHRHRWLTGRCRCRPESMRKTRRKGSSASG